MPEGGPNSGGGSHVSGNYRKGDRAIPSAKPEWAITVDPGRYLPNYEVDLLSGFEPSPDAEVLPVSQAFHHVNPPQCSPRGAARIVDCENRRRS
jgi:hypothetical protein